MIYKNNLNIKYEIGEDAFEMVMETNVLLNEKFTILKMIEPTLANWEFLDEHLLLWATEERISLIERWAEYTYQLEKRIKENAVSFENLNIEEGSNAVHYTVIAKEDLDYILTAKGAIITGFHGGYSYAKIPNEIDGYKVIKIGEGAFSEDPWLRYVYIPASVQLIEKNAFLNCYGLKKVVIPNESTIFGERTFWIYRCKIINEKEYKVDKGLGITLCGPSGSNVEVYANESHNLFESTDWDGKSVTEVYPVDDIYYINMVSELAWIAKSGKSFKGKKIVISGTLNFNSYNWTPIGNANNSFEGEIEISDCDIQNFESRQYGSGYYSEVRSGLFGEVHTNYILVSGLTMNEVEVRASGYQTVKAGSLFGKVQLLHNGQIIIEDSKLTGKVFATSDTTGGIIGSLVVETDAKVLIKEINVDWELGGTIAYLESMNEGGIIGNINNSGFLEITDCNINGNFIALGGVNTTGQSHPGRAGGVIGYITNNAMGKVVISKINSEFSAQTSSGSYISDFIGSIIAYVSANNGKIEISNTRNIINRQRGTFNGFIGGPAGVKNIIISNSYIINTGTSQTWSYQYVPYNIIWSNSYFLDANITCYTAQYYVSDDVKNKMKTLQSNARTEDELKQLSTFESWDFENVWCFEDGEYPLLLKQVEGKEHYKINAKALTGGTISTVGVTTVVKGKNITYKITPYAAFNIDKLIIDGKEKSAIEEYTFTNVSENHTIVAVFEEKARYDIDYDLNGGSLSENAPYFVNEGLTVKLLNPTKKGCMFAGWYDNPEFSGTEKTSISSLEACQ